jgi:hypothetical protein
MNFNFRNVLPKSADNDFKGHKIAFWGFVLFTILMTWRSIIHMLFEQYGFHEIGNFVTILGEPDPMPLIYRFFSLWGFAQLIFLRFYFPLPLYHHRNNSSTFKI